jgi:hypothetical protein
MQSLRVIEPGVRRSTTGWLTACYGLCVFVPLPGGVVSAGEKVEVEVEVGKSERLSGVW